MSTADKVLDHIRPGDILLHRKRTDPRREKTPDGIFGYWRNAYLCLGNKRAMCCLEGMCMKIILPMLLHESKDDYALFRLRDELKEGQFEEVIEGITEALQIDYNGFHFTFSQEELICIGYKNIGIDICNGPEWKTVPLDFDRSLATVRIL